MRRTLYAILYLTTGTSAWAQLPPPPVPDGNPVTVEKARLGKVLFWDEQLSSARTLACGTCHIPESGGSDPRSRFAPSENLNPGFDRIFGTEDDVIGSRAMPESSKSGHYVPEVHFLFGLRPFVSRRKSPSTLMAAYAPELHWDGRAEEVFLDPLTSQVVLAADAALESQALLPILSHREMASFDRTWTDVVDVLESVDPLALAEWIPPALETWIAGRDYPALFQEAFGSDLIDPVRIALALATYQRTLIPDQAPIDSYLGGDATALNAEEQWGLSLFTSDATSCSVCHPAPVFSNHEYVYTGVRPHTEDRGRNYITGKADDKGRMRVPSLRNAGLRLPLFHTGRGDSLAEVIEFYDRGGDFDAAQKSPLIRPLGLTTQEKAALVAFLGRPLNDPRVEQGVAPFDRPVLYSETHHVPRLIGGSSAGTGGYAPKMLALEPPVIGNPNMTIGVYEALGGAPALLAFGLTTRTSAGLPYANTFGSDVTIYRFAALDGEGPGEGYASLPLAVPNDPALVGQSVQVQWLVKDPGSPFGYSASEIAVVSWFD